MRENALMNSHYLTITMALLAFTLSLRTGEAKAETRFHYDSLLGARGNPKGLALKTTGQLRIGLYESDSKLFTQNFIGITY